MLQEDGFENCEGVFPTNFNTKTIQPEYSGIVILNCVFDINKLLLLLSGKMLVVDYILAVTKATTDDKVIRV